MTAIRPPGALRVPEITAFFWILKGVSTAFGESASDFLVHALPPVIAVAIGFVAFAIAMAIQFSKARYVAWAYWLAVAMVGVFGTMCADVLHVGLDVPYAASGTLFALALAAVFIFWRRMEGTLSIHSIDTPRREVFYWLAVVTTFALGTAVGDLTAVGWQIGYLPSAVLFAVLIVIPAISFWKLRMNAILAFWTAYVLTRPLGAAIADWLGKPANEGGVGVGNGIVTLVLGIALAAIVVYLQVTRRDEQRPATNAASGASKVQGKIAIG